ncbi:hypothetical protein H0H93_015830, partial [Arthromyces matolae]
MALLSGGKSRLRQYNWNYTTTPQHALGGTVLSYPRGHILGGSSSLTIDRGKRSSSATSYLAPHILKRPNLHVLVNTQVTRIIKTGTSRGRPEFGALEACCGRTGTCIPFPFRRVNTETIVGHCRRFHASKEIVLSAGFIATPHLLLLSGIGEPAQLRSVGIKPVLNLYDVGRNLSDHPALTLRWRVNSSETVD